MLVCPDRNVKRIFEITLLDRVFTIVDTRAEAFDELASSRLGLSGIGARLASLAPMPRDTS